VPVDLARASSAGRGQRCQQLSCNLGGQRTGTFCFFKTIRNHFAARRAGVFSGIPVLPPYTYQETMVKLLARVMSVGFFAMGVAWLYTFLFTDFRPHHGMVMVPVGALTILLSVGLFQMIRCCIAAGFIISIAVFSLSTWLQTSAGQLHVYFMVCSLVSIMYIVAFAFLLLRSRGTSWSQKLVA
jgi:hypothetical protein